MHHYRSNIYKILILCVLVAGLSTCRKSSYRMEEGIVWHTSYHITYNSPFDLRQPMAAVMKEVDDNLSAFNEHSQLSRLNASATVPATPMLSDVLRVSKQVHAHSGGYFDPSAAPLINAYGFGAKRGHMPDTATVSSLLAHIGLDKVSETGGKIVKQDTAMEFNFSALAKGYGCDCVARVLEEHGVRDYMVEIGGEIVLAGVSPRGGKWRISVDRPVESRDVEMHVSQLVMELTDCAIATSGSYRNYRDTGGKRVSHIVNPLTGMPLHSDVVSATIVAPTCVEADAYATACMAMPRREAEAMIRRYNLTAFLIMRDGTTFMTDSFSRLVAK